MQYMIYKKIMIKLTFVILISIAASTVLFAQTPLFNTDRLINFKHAGNRLTNGSFELGLGLEPIYPGWITNEPRCDAPDRPFIDDTQGATGNNSLCVKNVHFKSRVVISLCYPNFENELGKKYYLTFKFKSNKTNVHVLYGPDVTDANVNKWIVVKKEITSKWWDYIHFAVASKIDQEFDVWFDDFSIVSSENPDGNWSSADEVEAVFLPKGKSSSVHVYGQDVVLGCGMNAPGGSKKVNVELHLRDITRGGVVSVPFFKKDISLTQVATKFDIDLGKLKPGAYITWLAVSDASTNSLLTVARTRFTVMHDLSGIPSPIGFRPGLMCGLRAWGGSLEYCWRGSWTTDEYYDMVHDYLGLRAFRLYDLFSPIYPYKGVYLWKRLDYDLDSAKKHDMKVIYSIDVAKKLDFGKEIEEEFKKKGGWINGEAWMVRYGPRTKHFVASRETIKTLCCEIARRYKDRLYALELQNESNLVILGPRLFETVFEPAYKAMKKLAPDLPVMLNETMDGIYSTEGNHFLQQCFLYGCKDFTDGFSYHPYGRSTIGQKGISYGEFLKARVNEGMTPGKDFHLANTECLSNGQCGSDGWEIVQEFLLDWAVGAEISVGSSPDTFYFGEAGTLSHWWDRGARAPSQAGVATSALMKMIGGTEFTEQIKKDENLLILCSRNPDNGEYTVVMAGADDPARAARIDIALSGINYKMYDMYGYDITGETALPFLLSRNAVYFKSSDGGLLDAARNLTVAWESSDVNYEYVFSTLGADGWSMPLEEWHRRFLNGVFTRK